MNQRVTHVSSRFFLAWEVDLLANRVLHLINKSDEIVQWVVLLVQSDNNDRLNSLLNIINHEALRVCASK